MECVGKKRPVKPREPPPTIYVGYENDPQSTMYNQIQCVLNIPYQICKRFDTGLLYLEIRMFFLFALLETEKVISLYFSLNSVSELPI